MKLLSTREFVDTFSDLNWTVKKLDMRIKSGEIPAIRDGKKYKVWPAEIRSKLISQNIGNVEAITNINRIFDKAL